MLQAQDRAIAEAGLLGSMYWFGRVDQHLSDHALEEMLAAESLSMTAADIQLEAQRCGAEMEVRGKAMTDIGASPAEREAKRQTR